MKNYLNYLKFFLFVAFIAAAAIFLNAQGNGEVAPVSAQITVKTKKIEFARPFEVEVVLPAHAVLDAEKSASEDFVISAVKNDKKDILKLNITILPFNLGEQDFPPLIFVDENAKEIKTEPFKIDVKPAKTKIKTKGLADIQPPYRPFNWLYVFVSILTIAIIVYVYILFKKRRAKVIAPPATNPYVADGRPYHIIALEQIDKLLGENLWEQGLYKIFYIRIVDILCDYIAARFKINAHRYTSRDLANRMRTVPAFKGDISALRKFFKSADLVKFAKVVPSEAERDLDISELRAIIINTKQPETEEAVKN
jgi:hypothetical protein